MRVFSKMQLTSKQIEKFWSKVDKRGPDECWNWLGTTAGYQYRRVGKFWVGSPKERKGYMAHRLAATLMGIDIGSGHMKPLCGNDLCCNPNHQAYVRSGVAVTAEPIYNRERRNEFPLSTDTDAFLGALAPLRFGKTVVLTMDDPRFKAMKNYRGNKGTKILVLVPGSAMGIENCVLVSVLGSGSCMVRLKSTKVADLVLAGMPAKLADVLMQKLHRIFQE
jgi:hypothetical protein